MISMKDIHWNLKIVVGAIILVKLFVMVTSVISSTEAVNPFNAQVSCLV